MTNVLTVLRIILAVVFIGAGISHFAPTVQRTMAAMIPPRLRRRGLLAPKNLVIFTGLCEIAGGIGAASVISTPLRVENRCRHHGARTGSQRRERRRALGLPDPTA